jgi:protein-S-isoprenylcysteine O-methyltransferase Ste14
VTLLHQIARARVPLGFVAALVSLLLVQPTWRSWLAGAGVAVVGEGLRIWAAGHLRKGREITHTGPYRYVRHPLYLGSTLMAVGFAIAARSVWVGMLGGAYLGVTLWAAIRTEEATLDARFAGQYGRYRRGETGGAPRRFSWALARDNREYRAALGLLVVFVYLALRAAMRIPL